MRSRDELRRLAAALDDDCGTPSSALAEPSFRDQALVTPAGKACYTDRVTVGVKSFRRRLLDEDNLCPKYFVDGLRYAGIILGDEPGKVRIQVSQEKVSIVEDERTEITITPA